MRGRKDTPRGGAAKASLSARSREIARLRRVLWSTRVSARSFLAAKWQNHRDRKERGRSWKRLSPWVQQLRQQRARGVAVFSPRGALSSRGLFAGPGWACLYIMCMQEIVSFRRMVLCDIGVILVYLVPRKRKFLIIFWKILRPAIQ